jgi:hypothetical protein
VYVQVSFHIYTHIYIHIYVQVSFQTLLEAEERKASVDELQAQILKSALYSAFI